MKKSDREKIRNMFDGCCAYCGKDLKKTFHVDHIKPIYRGRFLSGDYREKRSDIIGKDEIDNMFPACPRCNIRKGTWTIEQFRKEISEQVNRLRLRSSQFRLAEDYGLIVDRSYTSVVFWFEKYKLTVHVIYNAVKNAIFVKLNMILK